MYEVSWGAALAAAIADRFGPERTAPGGLSESDFVAGPLAVALVAFRRFDELPEEAGPAVRSYHTVDPMFGAVVFVGVLVAERHVEIASYDIDPDYWDMVRGDPTD